MSMDHTWNFCKAACVHGASGHAPMLTEYAYQFLAEKGNTMDPIYRQNWAAACSQQW